MEIVIEFLLEIFGGVLLETVWASIKEAFGRKNHNPLLAAFGFLLLGGLVGGVWAWVHPGRLLSGAPIPGASVLLAPLLGGAAMHTWGTYRRSHGHSTTNLATFGGGATFAFAVAFVRLLGTR